MAEKNQGTALPVATTADLFPVIVGGMGASPKPREGKMSPDGEQTYASGCILMVQRKDGSIQPDKTASVHVVEPAANYEFGTRYRAQGKVWVQPYESNARVALSITVQRLVPLDGPTATPAQPQNGERRG